MVDASQRLASSTGVEEAIASIWRNRVAWSRVADKLKARISRARTTALTLSAAGALLETTAATLFANSSVFRTWFAGAGAVLLAVAAFISTRLVTPNDLRSWTRARSVSEAIKAEVYAFRAGADPYDGPNASQTLLTRVNDIKAMARDLIQYLPNDDFGGVVALPIMSREDYVKKRVEQQIEEYYRRQVARLRHKLKAFRTLEFGLGLVAAVLGAIAAIASGRGDSGAQTSTAIAAWVAVLTTVAGAVTTHIAANRYEFLVMSYAATAARLADLLNEWRIAGMPSDGAHWSKFVRECENAISIENESWLAKWAESSGGGG
jgi:hypothetical protein